jgi:hypothetical protein
VSDRDIEASKSSDTDLETGISGPYIEEVKSEPHSQYADQSFSVQSDEFQQVIQEETDIEKITEPQHSFKEETDIEKITEPQQSFQEELLPEFSERPVKSFDDLMSKYHIAPITSNEEPTADLSPKTMDLVVDESQFAEKTGFPNESKPGDNQSPGETHPASDTDNFISDEITDKYEVREEVVNEYGIFEEVKVKKTDFDMEAFDRPMINVPDHFIKSEETFPEMPAVNDGFADDDVFREDTEALNYRKEESSAIDDSDEDQSESDYNAFDRPIDHQEQEETESLSDLLAEEESISEIYSGQEERYETVESHQSADEKETRRASNQEPKPIHDQIPEPAPGLSDQRKITSPFDPKKTESIVFAPYHMIDYFASQGIKLVIEENPADPLTKQLKSFTDWLKVMKKLPAQAILDKTDEKDVDRVRHFAAHSVDDREILTESMAEVLAKQGMYENAIALFQKLSLIYPPKSAYFASRIEQLKASLP